MVNLHFFQALSKYNFHQDSTFQPALKPSITQPNALSPYLLKAKMAPQNSTHIIFDPMHQDMDEPQLPLH